MSFNDFIQKQKFKNKPTSDMKNFQVLSSLPLNDVGIHLRAGPLEFDIGKFNMHPIKGTHWVAYINENYFDSYCCPRKLSEYVFTRYGYCFYSEYKIQCLTSKKESYRSTYCLYKMYLTKVIGVDLKSAVLKLYYQLIH